MISIILLFPSVLLTRVLAMVLLMFHLQLSHFKKKSLELDLQLLTKVVDYWGFFPTFSLLNYWSGSHMLFSLFLWFQSPFRIHEPKNLGTLIILPFLWVMPFAKIPFPITIHLFFGDLLRINRPKQSLMKIFDFGFFLKWQWIQEVSNFRYSHLKINWNL